MLVHNRMELLCLIPSLYACKFEKSQHSKHFKSDIVKTWKQTIHPRHTDLKTYFLLLLTKRGVRTRGWKRWELWCRRKMEIIVHHNKIDSQTEQNNSVIIPE